MACNWSNNDYFTHLIFKDKRSQIALEMLVDDIHSEKHRTISTFLCHSGSEDFLWSLVRLLGNDIPRIISLAKKSHSENKNVLSNLMQMLTFDDPESVMNAAGTLGTLAESADGREWMLSEPCIESTLDHVTNLLHDNNLWTASNAALVLARLSISAEGCSCILKHPNSQYILTCLIQALGADEAGRGMNAAFAIGRLCDMDAGRQCLLNFSETEKMISSLVKMLSCEDIGAGKNACFALSCLAANHEGHSHLLNNLHLDIVLKTLSQLLSAEDSETGWFAAMTLRTLASQPKGCLKLREFSDVYSSLKKVEQLADVNSDLKEEVLITLEILRPLDPPDAPTVTVLGPNLCSAGWNKITTKYGFDIWHQLFEGNECVYNGPKCQCEIGSLSSHTTYSFRVRAVNEIEESAFSDATTVTTEEDLPEAPQNLKILGTTATQLKVGWNPPENFNGVSKGYYIYLGKTLVEHTMELSAIISGLVAGTDYEIQVCAATAKGKGLRSACTGNTSELGAHTPGKPHVQVLGRNEVHVSWEPPEVPMGRINRYDVSMNGKIIYSGTELSCGVHRLTPDTEYSFIVTALTNEGKFDSKTTKKRTAKDEFDPDRPPLYQPPKREEEPQKSSQKKRKSTEVKTVRVQSSEESHASSCSDHSVSGISAASSPLTHSLVAKTDKSKEDYSQLPSSAQKPKIKDLSSKKENMNPKTNKELTTLSSSRKSSLSISGGTTREVPSNSSTQKIYTSRINELPKPSVPVTVSYVSIHGGDDQNLTLNVSGSEHSTKKTLIQSSAVYSNTNPILQVEHSRIKFTYSNSQSNKQCKLEKIDSHDPINKDLLQADSDYNFQPSQNTSNLRLSLPVSETSIFLPKPTVPSSDYLDGSRNFSINSGTSFSCSLPSTRTSMNQDLADETKPSVSDFQYHKGQRKDGEHSSLVHTHPRMAADSCFHDAQHALIHKTNMFIKSHRPAQKKTAAQGNLTGTASILFTDNKPYTSNSHKFVPVQYRTQPNHLTASQLQRVNTTLSETGRGTLSDRRLDALIRNKTQISLSLQPQTSATNQMVRQLRTATID